MQGKDQKYEDSNYHVTSQYQCLLEHTVGSPDQELEERLCLVEFVSSSDHSFFGRTCILAACPSPQRDYVATNESLRTRLVFLLSLFFHCDSRSPLTFDSPLFTLLVGQQQQKQQQQQPMVHPDLLGGSDDDGDDNAQGDESNSGNRLVINKRYAKDFQLRKQREDLRNNPHLLGSSDDDDDASTTSSSSDEDEEGALLTTKLDTDIMKTIRALRSKDSRIYDPNVRFFGSDADNENEEEDSNDDREKKRKPKRYKDVVREQALEQIEKGLDGIDDDNDNSDSSDDDDAEKANVRRRGDKSHRLAYDKEQEDIRKSFLQSTNGLGKNSDDEDDDDDEGDDWLVVKKKNPKQVEEEEKEFAKEIQRIESTLQGSDYVDPKGEVDDGSKFLMNYFRNRAWIDKDNVEDDDSSHNDDDGKPANDWNNKLKRHDDTEADEALPMKSGEENDGNESDASLNQLDKTDDFEAQYNFRFEEAAGMQSGADFSLISYARGQTVNTLRRKDETRREKRLARKERKAAERKAKEEELKRLKNLKRKEMERKLNEVKKVVGLTEDDADIDEAAILKLIEGDYNPEEFEKKMQETFGDDFYSKEDTEWRTDKDVKEALMKDEDGNLIVGDEDEGDLYDTNVDDEIADETCTEENEEENWEEEEYYAEGEGGEETELERKIKAKMEDELYKLDYEDIVAGMPTRFKYRQVEPNRYGLTTEEILFARDTTLKQFVSLKKMAPYREDGEFTVGGRRRRKFREQLKHEIEEEMGPQEMNLESNKTNESQESTNLEPEVESKKRKRRKSKKRKSKDDDPENKDEEKVSADDTAKPMAPDESEGKNAQEDDHVGDSEPKRKRRRRQKKKKSVSHESGDGQQPAEGIKHERVEDASVEKLRRTEVTVEKASKITTTANQDQHEKKTPSAKIAQDTTATKSRMEQKSKKEKKDKHKRDKKKSKKSGIEGITKSRLSSYGL